jgi:dGTPase
VSISRIEIERRERQTLAPYAALSGRTRGRVYPLDEHPLRTSFQRDRDRIIHSAAFRRLEYKTQVFIPHEKDHFRTRLTHSIEVAQIARTLARSLQLNEDLTEAVALVHDLGHTPFGHAGEDVLDELLSDHGGFNHNRQSLRVVEILEQRYPDHPGLNLTYEVREGIVKHETSTPLDVPGFDGDRHPTLEASLVDVADEIAYNSHDIDDGLAAGIVDFETLRKSGFFEKLIGEFPEAGVGLTGDYQRYALVRRLVDRMATDVVNETASRLERLGIGDLDAVRRSTEKICAYSGVMAELVDQLKGFLRNHLYNHSHLVAMSQRARDIITTVFTNLLADPSLMPLRFQKMLEEERIEIVAADYVAGMTDRYAEKVYEQVESRG